MKSKERIQFLADCFNFPVEVILDFLDDNKIDNSISAKPQFLFLLEKHVENSRFIEYCLLTKKGRFLRLLDHLNSSVDIREAAQYIDSVESEYLELKINWDGQLSDKQYFLILDYCPPLYCGSNCN